MNKLRVLITTYDLSSRGGTQMYVRDLAVRLLELGHTPIVYSTQLGNIARELRERTIVVTDDLDTVSKEPDIIHGNHSLETLTALLQFPNVPAVHSVHGNLGFLSAAPRFPRILRYLPVDYTCCDRIVYEYGIPEDRIRVILNSVDLKRFKPRSTLPATPKRALIFSNYTDTHIDAVRVACTRTGLSLDVIGADSTVCENPESVLGKYDIVFAKARCALEAMAVGTSVILCGYQGLGPMVTNNELQRLRSLNFGHRTLINEISPDLIVREIKKYDPVDAAQISQTIRSTASLDKMVDAVVAQYNEVLAEYRGATVRPDPAAEFREAASYLRWLTIRIHSDPSAKTALKTVLSRIPLLNSPQITDLIVRVASKLGSPRRQRKAADKN